MKKSKSAYRAAAVRAAAWQALGQRPPDQRLWTKRREEQTAASAAAARRWALFVDENVSAAAADRLWDAGLRPAYALSASYKAKIASRRLYSIMAYKAAAYASASVGLPCAARFIRTITSRTLLHSLLAKARRRAFPCWHNQRRNLRHGSRQTTRFVALSPRWLNWRYRQTLVAGDDREAAGDDAPRRAGGVPWRSRQDG